ncbi:MAG: ROK family protein, partial [Acidobacteriota bacterium]
MDLFGGIDLGGTFIKAAAVDGTGTIQGRAKIPTGVQDGRDKVLERMARALSQAAEQAGGPLQAAGVGVPGLVSPEGIILRFPNFPGWDGFPLQPALSAQLGLPTVIENDANAAAIAEGIAGAATGQRDYIFITLGTGVGAGLVLDGRLHRGRHGKAAELGHVKVQPGGLLCGCGARGCVEQYASGTALAREGNRAVEEGHLPPPGKGGRVTPAWLQSLALDGNPVAREIFSRGAVFLALAL